MSLEQYYRRERRFFFLSVLLLIGLCVVAMWIATLEQPIAFFEVPHIIGKYIVGEPLSSNEKIVLLMRIPRVILGIASGIGLALAGSVMQSVTRNYLVSPFTLGISASAAFGASLCIAFGTGFLHTEGGIILGAFLAASGCTFFVYNLTTYIGMTPTSLVLVGIAMNYFFSAMNATVEFFAVEHKLGEIVQWTFGTLNRATWMNSTICVILVILAFLYLWRQSLPLNGMAQNNDEVVLSLGINPNQLRMKVSLVAVLMTSTIISFTGVIGFVGLVAPHIARLIVGNDHRLFLPFSALLGAWLLLISDTAGKFLLYPISIPVGIVVSFIGVPLFVNLIVTSRRQM